MNGSIQIVRKKYETTVGGHSPFSAKQCTDTAVQKSEGYLAMEKVKDEGDSKGEKKRMRIRVCKRTVIPSLSQAKVTV